MTTTCKCTPMEAVTAIQVWRSSNIPLHPRICALSRTKRTTFAGFLDLTDASRTIISQLPYRHAGRMLVQRGMVQNVLSRTLTQLCVLLLHSMSKEKLRGLSSLAAPNMSGFPRIRRTIPGIPFLSKVRYLTTECPPAQALHCPISTKHRT